MLGEEVHEDGLDSLGLVDDGLCADVEATDGLGVNVVLLEEVVDGWESEGMVSDMLEGLCNSFNRRQRSLRTWGGYERREVLSKATRTRRTEDRSEEVYVCRVG
jgi:hypothetical protein